MRIVSHLPGLSVDEVRRILAGLPQTDYVLHLRPLRYRKAPHLAGLTEFDERRITVQLPEPFLPFGAVVHHSARRVPANPSQRGRLRRTADAGQRGYGGRVGARGKGLRFVWLSEGLTFTRPREVLRFVYLHEWMHWYLKERLGRKSAAETACDRFALRNYLRRAVTVADADTAVRRSRR